MEPSIAQYIGFIVLVIIMGVLAMALNRRIEKRRMAAEQASRRVGWVNLNVQQESESADEPLPPPEPEIEPEEEHADESDGQNMHTRAKQNGHYTESKKLG